MTLSPLIRLIVSRDGLRALALCATVVATLFSPLPRPRSLADEKPAARPIVNPQQQPEETRKPQPRVTVSKQTTRILQPLGADGYVDYLGALNQMASQGVTPENNAGVLFVRALGLNGFDRAKRARFFKLLKIAPLSERGEYLPEFDEFVMKKLGRPPTKKEQADFYWMNEPWSERDFPLVAEWLTSYEKPLALIVEGARRPKCFIPLVESGHLGLVAVPMRVVQESRSAARALAARALLRLREGKVSEAEQDLLACHRLGRLVGSMPLLIPAMVGIAIDSIACQGDGRLMEYAHLSAEGALAYQQELRKLPSLPVMADVIDTSERFTFLDEVLVIARDQKEPLHGVPNTLLKAYWDEILEFGNAQFDKTVAAARQPTAPERKKAFEVLDRELRAMRSEVGDLVDLDRLLSQGRSIRKTAASQVGKALTVMLMPAVGGVCATETRARTRDALGQLGFALSAYRADHGAYPESLSVLASRYIAQVPHDLFAEQPLHYKRQGDGFLLYSVGANGVDDGGSTFDSQPPGDDVVLRILHEPAVK